MHRAATAQVNLHFARA